MIEKTLLLFRLSLTSQYFKPSDVTCFTYVVQNCCPSNLCIILFSKTFA